MIVLSYRGRTLEVSADVIKTFAEMEITRQAKVKEKEQAVKEMTAKAGYAEVEALKAATMSMEVLLLLSSGVDVEDEVTQWRALVDGVSDRIYIAGKDFLGVNVALTGCDATDIDISGDGTWKQAKLKLSFTQCETGKTAKSTGKKLTAEERFQKLAADAWKKANPNSYTKLTKEQKAEIVAKAEAARKAAGKKTSTLPTVFGPTSSK